MPRKSTAILNAEGPTFAATADASSIVGMFLGYLVAGVVHLAGGFDHVVFLLMLMLPAVTIQPDKRRAVLQVATAITGFTMALALTLIAASTNLLLPPTDLITFLVAGSIVITALDNIWPFLSGPRAAVAAFFGLIHGFGFATVHSGSAMIDGAFATALQGFNIGIDIAQIGIVALTPFALMTLRGGKVLLWLASLTGAVAGEHWNQVAGRLVGKPIHCWRLINMMGQSLCFWSPARHLATIRRVAKARHRCPKQQPKPTAICALSARLVALFALKTGRFSGTQL